jgi:hypothetical protein
MNNDESSSRDTFSNTLQVEGIGALSKMSVDREEREGTSLYQVQVSLGHEIIATIMDRSYCNEHPFYETSRTYLV